MTVDLTNVSKQVRGFYNSGITTGYACAQVAYKCLTSPTDYPINDGSFRSLKVIVPPKPHRQRHAAGADAVVDDLSDDDRGHAVQGARAGDLRSRHRGHHADLLVASLHGINPKTSEFFIANFGPLGGGWGAKRSEDGISATVCINDGDTHNSPNEQAEAKFPLVVRALRARARLRRRHRRRAGLGVEEWCGLASR